VGDRVVELSGAARVVVGKTIHEVCEHKGWKIWALNVRTNHVHVVVAATSKPEMVMNALKAWSTRRLVEVGIVERRARVWTRHGSTVYLFTPEKLAEKCDYVINQQ
jgi:REP element-mobilizing transposase RayT